MRTEGVSARGLVHSQGRNTTACVLPPCLFNLCAEHILWHAGLHESQAGIKTARRNINNPRYAHDTTVKAESEEELKSL